ncbi:hypothetical protein BB560_005348 [Smittium megazygosporum]|uniref:UBX domain-containing protein n=1 Tax=Smittium megazygosporum TaxID=133381 RepID=A0A2T9Z6V7_9FUNG|nr:hypothetical protein BB560_005348 [Smittium megazygosporum]
MDDQINQFTEITGSSKEVALDYLKISDGNLEAALSLYWESDGKLLSSTDQTAATSSRNSGTYADSSLDTGLDPVRAPIASKRERLVDDYVSYDNFRMGHAFRNNQNRQILIDPFRNFANEASRISSGLVSESEQPSSLSDLFRPPIESIFQANFERAKSHAEQSQKWLLVNIQSVTDFECQVLNRDIWRDRNVKDILKKYFIFCQYINGTDSADQFNQLYNVKSFPHIAIIDPRTGERLKYWGPKIELYSFLEQLVDFVYETPYSGDDAKPSSSKSRKRRNIDFNKMSDEEMLRATIQASIRESNNSNLSSSTSNAQTRPYEISSDSGGYSQDSVDLLSDGMDVDNYFTDDSVSSTGFDSDNNTFSSTINPNTASSLATISDSSVKAIDDLTAASNTSASSNELSEKLSNLNTNTLIKDIPARNPPEPEISQDATRIQFRYPDGSKKVRRFLKSDSVHTLFEYAKYTVAPEDQGSIEVCIINV